nr:MAG TPA: hypothetical protein [Caudoviricetes sp.]
MARNNIYKTNTAGYFKFFNRNSVEKFTAILFLMTSDGSDSSVK